METAPLHHRLRDIATDLERDRREPDKVLCYVSDLRRLATEIAWVRNETTPTSGERSIARLTES